MLQPHKKKRCRLITMLFLRTALGLLLSITIHGEWKIYPSGTLTWFHSIFFVNEKLGWIVGSSGTVYTSNDGGITWLQNKKITRDVIRDVYFADTEKGWLLCEEDGVSAGERRPSYLMETLDGGGNWKRLDLAGGSERFVRFVVAPSGDMFLFGESGALWTTTGDKKAWKKVETSVQYLILGGAFAGDLRGILVGGAGSILSTDDGGKRWKLSFINGVAGGSKLNAAFFAGQYLGWIAGAGGKIYFTSDGGKTWQPQTSGTKENLSDLYFLNESEGFAAGENGTILHTTTQGSSWVTETVPSNHKIERLAFVGKTGFAVGFGGTIMRRVSRTE